MNKINIPEKLTVKQLAIAVAAVLVVALGMRLVMVNQTVVKSPLSADAGEYFLYTVNMKHYGVYSLSQNILKDPQRVNTPKADAQRPPGYSLFLYPFFDMPPVKEMFDTVLTLQALLSTVTVLIAFLLYQSFLGWKGSLAAAILTTLSPHLIAANVYILTETLFTFFLVFFAYAFSRLIKTENYYWAVAAGALLGCTMLVKPTMNYFILFMVPAFFILFPASKVAKPLGLLILGCSLVYGPWIIRNSVSVDDASKASKALASMHKGMYPNIMYNNDKKTIGYPNRFDPTWKDRRDYGAVLKEIGRRFAEDPLGYGYWYLIGKPLVLLSWNMVVGMGDIYIYSVKTSPYFTSSAFSLTHKLMYLLHWPVIALAIFALVVVWLPVSRNWLSDNELIVGRFCTILLGYFLIVHMVALPLPRYAIPVKPVIYGLSMLGIHFCTVLIKSKLAKQTAESSSV